MSDWKIGDEFAPFHPDASHVEPGYRDGWNACYAVAAAEIEKLRAAVTALRAELDNIASADPSKWDADVRDQFRQWVQSRARHALRLADEAMGNEERAA